MSKSGVPPATKFQVIFIIAGLILLIISWNIHHCKKKIWSFNPGGQIEVIWKFLGSKPLFRGQMEVLISVFLAVLHYMNLTHSNKVTVVHLSLL